MEMTFAARDKIDHSDHAVTIGGTHGRLKCPLVGGCGKSGVPVLKANILVTDHVMDCPASVKHFGQSQRAKLHGKKTNHVKRARDN